MTKRIIPKTEEEWKKCREEGIGSSELGTIFGYNSYQSMHDWWMKKTHRVPEDETNEAMMRGHFMEDSVAQYFAYKTGSSIIKSSADNIIYYDEAHPHRRVTPDRFCWIPNMKHDPKRFDNKFILECKTYNGYLDDGSYPKYWYIQVMYQLGVCGCPYAYLAWIDSHLKVDYVRIDFDQKQYDAICSVLDSVWETNIIKDIEPPITKLSEVVSRYSKEEEGKSISLGNDIANKVMQYKSIQSQIKELQDEADKLKDEFAVALGDAESAIDPAGVTLFTFKAQRRFNPDEVKKQDPELYKQFLTPQPDKFDAEAFKANVGNKVYKSFCTGIGSRTLKVK